MSYLVEAILDDLPVQGLPFQDGEIVFGSKSTCSMVLEGDGVESEHARLVIAGDSMRLWRLSKKEPLYVNRNSVNSTIITRDDVLHIGPYLIKFIDSGFDESGGAYDTTGLKMSIHQSLVVELDLGKLDLKELSDHDLWVKCDRLIDRIIKDAYIPSGVDVKKLKLDVLREALALGPLEELLEDEAVTEIMVNAKDEIFIEKGGNLTKTELAFTSDAQVVNVISRIVNPLGRRIDESSPLVDARLKDGSRVNAIIPPLALKGPSISIRKFAKEKFKAEDLIGFGSITAEIVEFLKFSVSFGKRNVVISGGTGSGKTTLLNLLSNFIPDKERIVSIEDSAELQLNQPNLVSLEARPPNIEGKGAITIRDLVKNSLRMRPDRVVVGECRGAETLDMLQAMNTGHDGSLTTLHANDAAEAVLRIETMVMMAGFDLPVAVIRRQICSAVNIIVQQNRLTDGSRRITRVCEVVGIDGLDVLMEDIFLFKRTGFNDEGRITGYFTATGYVPQFVKDAEKVGMKLDSKIFEPTPPPGGQEPSM
tara:strand:+ start:46802 stop:48409 length:1608 start_codon:yes stop_codon:yes gene_type:complete